MQKTLELMLEVKFTGGHEKDRFDAMFSALCTHARIDPLQVHRFAPVQLAANSVPNGAYTRLIRLGTYSVDDDTPDVPGLQAIDRFLETRSEQDAGFSYKLCLADVLFVKGSGYPSR